MQIYIFILKLSRIIIFSYNCIYNYYSLFHLYKIVIIIFFFLFDICFVKM
jgi:hypothetical protein